MDFTLLVFIPRLREEPFEFSGHVVNGAAGTGAIFEDLELRNFPLDVQRLHAKCVFNFDETTLGNVSQEAVSSSLIDNPPYFDITKLSVKERDSEWALDRDAVEIWGRPIPDGEQGKVFEIVLIVRRRPLFYIVNIGVPVWCIVLFSFISFRFGAAELGARLQNFLAFELLTRAPWFNWVSAWALMGLWTAMNVFMGGALFWAMQFADTREKKEDADTFLEEDCVRVVNLLRKDLAIEKLWYDRSGATVDMAMEKVALQLDPKKIEDMYTAALKGRKAVLKERHEDTQRSRHKLDDVQCALALASGRNGQGSRHPGALDGKAKMDEEARAQLELSLREKAYFADHPETLASLSDLAHALEKQGRLVEAGQKFEYAMTARGKALGSLVAAEALFRRALEGRQKWLGDDNAATRKSLVSLANVLRDQGKLKETNELRARGRHVSLVIRSPKHVKNSVTVCSAATDVEGSRSSSRASLLSAPGSKGVIVEWYLHEIGAAGEYDVVSLDMKKKNQKHNGEAYTKINPFGKLPALIDGDLKLFESGAILLYLADKHGQTPTAANRAAAAKWVLFTNSTFTLGVFVDAIRGRQAPELLKVLDELLASSNTLEPGLSGGDVSVADVCVCSHLFLAFAMVGGLELHTYRHVWAYMTRLAARPAAQVAMAAVTAAVLQRAEALAMAEAAATPK
ncbi:hypothetical protein FOA52_002157 [Chlamydomonas sp. UWO 241]|nr:hypothetical protein FOA52_002157 [Chlamydomonas sp. UWO 241]